MKQFLLWYQMPFHLCIFFQSTLSKHQQCSWPCVRHWHMNVVRHRPKFKQLSVYCETLQYNQPRWKGKVRKSVQSTLETQPRSWFWFGGQGSIHNGMPSSCTWSIFRWQRRRKSFSDIRNKWAKAQIMEVHGISGKGEETEFLEHGAWSCVRLACSHWVSIPKLWLSWGQARDCALFPF